MKPQQSRRRDIVFTVLTVITAAVNCALGAVNFSIWTDGAFAPQLNRVFGPTMVQFLWTTIVGTAFALIATETAHILSLDPWRSKRPRGRLYLLFASLGIFLAGDALGARSVASDNFIAFIGAAAVVLIFPLLFLQLEKVAGLSFRKTAEQLYRKGASHAALRFARLSLAFTPGRPGGARILGLLLADCGRLEEAKPFLEDVFAGGDHEPDVLAALGAIHEAEGDKRGAADISEELYKREPGPELLQRLISLLRETGQNERALAWLQALPHDIRHKWLDTIRDLLFETGNLAGVRALAHELEAEGPPLSRAREIYNRLLAMNPNDTATLEAVVELHGRTGDQEAAAEILERLVTLTQDNATYRRRLIAYYRASDNMDLYEFGQALASPALVEHYRTSARTDSIVRHLDALIADGVANLDEKIEAMQASFATANYRRVTHLIRADDSLAQSAQARYLLASTFFETGRYSEASEEVGRARELGPDASLKPQLIALETRVKNAILAADLEQLGQRVRANPQDLELKFQYLDRLAASGATDKVVVEFEALLERQPDLRDRIVSDIERMLTKYGRNSRLMSYLSDIYLREQNWDKVYQLTEEMAQESMHPDEILTQGVGKILARHPTHTPSLIAATRLAFKAGDMSAAVETLDRYVAAGGDRSEELLQLEFDASTRMEDWKRAAIAGQRLLAMRPKDTALLMHFANASIRERHYPDALAYLFRARDAAPEDRKIREAIKTTEESQKEARIEELRATLEKTPADLDLREELGDLLHDFGRLNEAIVEYQRAALADKSHHVARAKLGYVLTRKEMYPDAEEVIVEAELRPDQPPGDQAKIKALLYNSANLMEENRQEERALHLYKRIFRVDAGYRDVVGRIERLQRVDQKKR